MVCTSYESNKEITKNNARLLKCIFNIKGRLPHALISHKKHKASLNYIKKMETVDIAKQNKVHA